MWLRRLKDKSLASREAALVEQSAQKESRKTWRQWRMELAHRRTERWQFDMKQREKTFVAKKSEMMLDEAFQVGVIPSMIHHAYSLQHWHVETRFKSRTRTADAFYYQRKLALVYDHWLDVASRNRRLAALLADYETFRDSDAIATIFGVWHKRTSLERLERGVSVSRDRAPLRRAWDQWRMTRCLAVLSGRVRLTFEDGKDTSHLPSQNATPSQDHSEDGESASPVFRCSH